MGINRHHYGQPLQVAIEEGALVIRIGAQTLAQAVAYSDWANPFDEKQDDYIRTFAITNAEAFAADVHRAMLDEREDGSSPLSDFLDEMTAAAVDDGSEACEPYQQIKHGETASIEIWAQAPAEEQSPAPVERLCVNCARVLVGTWPSDDLRRAFVAGASWWQFYKNGATIFPSERDEAEAEAERRYAKGRAEFVAGVSATGAKDEPTKGAD